MPSTKSDRRVRRIDLDAAAREANLPEGLVLTLGGVEYELPAELPIDVLDPFLSDDLVVVDLIRTANEISKQHKDLKGVEPDTFDLVLRVLDERPGLHRQIIGAFKASLESLLGEDQYATYVAARPSIEGLARFVGGLMDEYGVSLGELFASPTLSGAGGATQKATSGPTTDSTSATPESTTETND